MATFRRTGLTARYLGPILLLTMVFAAPASAGAMKFKWWQSERFIRELALTPEQQTRLEGIFKSSWPSLEACKGDLDRLDSELSRLIADGTTPETQVIQQIDRVEASRSALGRARSLMLYRMYRVLTPEQRMKLKALNEQMEKDQQAAPKAPSPR